MIHNSCFSVSGRATHNNSNRHATTAVIRAAGARSTGSSLKRQNWSRRVCGCCDRFSGRFRRVLGVRHPQPGSRRSARSAARTNGLEAGCGCRDTDPAGSGQAVRGVELSGSVSWFAEDQSEASRRGRLPVIPSPRPGGMRRCGSSGTGSIKGATTPPRGVGVMTPAITRLAGFHPAHTAPLASARISPSRRP
jgi:hypothetical protein